MNLRIWLFLGMASSAWGQTVVVDSGASEEIGAGARLVCGRGGVEVRSSGSLSLLGASSANQAKFLGLGDVAKIAVLSGGTVDIRFARFENLLTASFAAGSKIRRLHDTDFVDLDSFDPGTYAWLNFANLAANDRPNIPFSFNRVTFLIPDCSSGRVNVNVADATPTVRFLGGNPDDHTTRWGEGFDQDPFGRAFWHVGAVVRTSPAGTFDTIEAGLADGQTTDTSTLTVGLGPLAFIDQNIDWNNYAYSSSTGPTIAKACLAPMIGDAIQDLDSATAPRGIFVNCVVARGNVSETTLNNCTIYNPNGAITLKDVAGNNVLVESDYVNGLNNNFTNSVLTATSTFFIGSAGYDFHLANPGGNAAINTGGGTFPATDWEDEARPVGATVDVGADEYGQAIVLSPSRKTRFMTQPVIQAGGTPGQVLYLYRNGVYTGLFATVDVNGIATFPADTTAVEGVQYNYQVSYQDDGTGLSSSFSAITVDTTPSAAPTNCRVTRYTSCIDVEWDASVSSDAIGYRVYRSVNGGGFSVIHTGVVVGLKYRDESINGVDTFTYRVTALDDSVNY